MDTVAKKIQQAFVDAANTRRIHDHLPRFFIECIKSVLEKAGPILLSERDCSRRPPITERKAFHECVQKMIALAQKMIKEYEDNAHKRDIETDDNGDDDDDVLYERAELLKEVNLLKDLLKQEEFCSFTTTS